ncbi:MAG: alpha/beta fold hydrolase [Microlunatus sp.]|nr:alpha/beta fold hydrolase [Microlunatus sp.]MDN5803459.1 alpha/beta fold hydrolase [Microlunatus sp.]
MAREAGWVTAHLLMYPLGLLTEPTAKVERGHTLGGLSPHQRGLAHYSVDAVATPILLVHGIVDNHTIFAPLERALRRRGFTDLPSFDYGVLTSDVRETAGRLATAVERLVAESGYEKVHVIGHSLGGLITRYYVQRMGGHERVHTAVTLGTPHQGTALARAGSVLPLVRQLRPDSDLIAELNQAAADCDTRFLAFYSDLDQLVLPSRNARIEHPDLRVRNVRVRGIGHMSLTNDGGIAFQIAAALAQLDGQADFDVHESSVASSLLD